MPNIVFFDGFELGSIGAASHTGAAKYWDTATNATATTSLFVHGQYSLLCAPTASAVGQVVKNLPAGHRTLTLAFYVRIGGSLPGSDLTVARVLTSGSAFAMRYRASSGKFAITQSTDALTDVGQVIAPDVWYRVDWTLSTAGSPWSQSASVEGSAPVTITRSGTGFTALDMTAFQLGSSSASGPAASIYFDDFVASYDTADFPIGPPRVEPMLPNADGTHNAGTNVMEDQTGADIGVVPAYPLLDADTATFIRQNAVGAGNYAEVSYAIPVDASGFWAVQVYQASKSAGTATNAATSRVVDGVGTTLTDIFSGDMSDTGLRYTTKLVPAPVGGWTQANIDALKVRVGFGTTIPAGTQPQWVTIALGYAIAGGGPVALAGTATGSSSATTSMEVARALRGHAQVILGTAYVDEYVNVYNPDLAANLSIVLRMAGSATGTSSGILVPSVTEIDLVGTATGTSDASAVLIRERSLLGAATGISAALATLRVDTGLLVDFAIWTGIDSRPAPFDAYLRPRNFYETVFIREDRSLALSFVFYGPFTENEIPEALLIRVLRPLRAGGTTPLVIFGEGYSATVSIEPPTGPVSSRACEILDPDDLASDYPLDFTGPEDGWLRITWEDGDFADDGTYSVQVTLDNGTVRLKSTEVWQPNVNTGPASAVT